MAARAAKASMPTSVTGRRTNSRGFTLVEILVVMVIIATVVSIAMLSISLVGDDRELDRERIRFASLVEMVQDEAMMQGREFGVEIMLSAYRFVEFDPFTRQWALIPGDDLFRERSLPEGIEFELYVDEKLIPLAREAKKIDDPDKAPMNSGIQTYMPHLFVFASGEATAYELRFRRPQTDTEVVMRGNVLGEIEFGEEELQ